MKHGRLGAPLFGISRLTRPLVKWLGLATAQLLCCLTAWLSHQFNRIEALDSHPADCSMHPPPSFEGVRLFNSFRKLHDRKDSKDIGSTGLPNGWNVNSFDCPVSPIFAQLHTIWKTVNRAQRKRGGRACRFRMPEKQTASRQSVH